MWIDPYQRLVEYLRTGGVIMPPLLGAMAMIWYAVGARWAVLRRGSRLELRDLVARARAGDRWPPKGLIDAAAQRGIEMALQPLPHLRHRLDDEFFDYQKAMRKYAGTITVLVAMSPLLGLLGTVSGMIETFRSMATLSFFSQSGGIAAGIAEALHATQMGLAVAVPGLVLGRILDNRQDALETELRQLKELLSSEFRPEVRA